MSEWIIKKFNELTLEELYEITRSRNEVFVMEQKIICEEDLDGVDYKCIHVFKKENHRVIAYCRIVPSGTNYENISIGRVLTLKDFRRRGIARDMINESVKYIKENLNEEKVVLSSQLYAKKLYENAGFIENSEVYEEAGIPHVKMYKVI